jgi:SAM-dependent methyltransferase
MPAQNIDVEKQNSFLDKVLRDLSGTYVTMACSIGDRLGLFKDLSANGPATSGELAMRTQINERYAREWLSCLTCAGYLEYDPSSSRFKLPPEYVAALAEEGGPMFVAGTYQGLIAESKNIIPLAEAFKKGGGIPPEAYDQNEWDGLERFTSTWFENLLVQQWIPAVPDVKIGLERGIAVADIGCGRGRALIKLAQKFPNSRFTGYDSFPPTIERARKNATEAGVEKRVSFKYLNVVHGLPDRYDLITTFDVIHDMVDPRGALRAIRNALRPGGTYLLLDFKAKDHLEENIGTFGAMAYGFSLFYCLTVSLAEGGVGLGTMGLSESKVRELCTEVGFGKVRLLDLDNPFNALYEIKP